ncbi:LysE family transporter [Verrucosispora sp. WMMD573]|uniref:LysE/ArgO family amino acid transporter n=1 Tax=Verrucosispora sp. WMMD573 TaxID=3015149 RepID=UPI00248AD693|nr:LysE family transporter [Verrucosispora sp. WMMD573]WBB54051.1 LysE family transporter [Verrucosispora sp. WMMD573]
MTGAFLAGLVAGYGVAVPVGAIAVLILGLTARTSFRVGAGAALGVATADGLYAGVAALGGAVVAGWLAPLAGPLRLVGAAVLLILAAHGAWRALRIRGPRRCPSRPPTPAPAVSAVGSPDRSAVVEAAPGSGPSAVRRGLDTPSRAFVGILALTLLNPATIVYFTALVLGRADLGSSGTDVAVVFTLGVFLASASWQLLVAGGGSMIGQVLANDRGRLVTALLSSAIITVLAVGMLLGG